MHTKKLTIISDFAVGANKQEWDLELLRIWLTFESMANDLLSSWRLSLLTSLILLFLGLCLCDLPSPKKLDLSTASWTFSSANGTYRGIAVVPGDIYGDLHRNNLIDEPLFGDNDRKLRWISESDWIYRCDFYLGKEWNKVG
ncbi:hypothetical protein AB6A40_010670 [Gnathostoma spinigerum]|uniref:Beta-mannosidase-like galactose-binding domain-containing protein n=1 Tax=Gnathostoma spinigerum TaxID=75299 RepID=A0ABD6EVP0_9BILA